MSFLCVNWMPIMCLLNEPKKMNRIRTKQTHTGKKGEGIV